MAIPRRIIVIVSSIILMLVIAVSLASSLDIRTKPSKIIQLAVAQAVTNGTSDFIPKVKGELNSSDFDRAGVLTGSSILAPATMSTFYFDADVATTKDSDGFIGQTPTPAPSASVTDEGYIGPIETVAAIPTPKPAPISQSPIFMLSYTSSGGPKHCRGELIQKLTIPQPASAWKNGSCVDLPSEARCGVFWAGKDDNCEAELFTMPACLNTSSTYINTVVFMPEERAVGAKWMSMYVRCGVDAPEAGPLNPALLGGLLTKPGKKPGSG
ncbi:hypothetical protein K504DRAFT_472791 [Pleomassaria siparia CBS 279.74]|uniref:Uncharacterized protein n=1 Tax=Pleomassaria siparia CBS 279.74 TaxID=1314801 RepID=A0A6G1KLM2_9PLEO|nr:hypothetical protein K504DRAFT_472791 [Pleomassaria siparia CBS 279.74]